MTQAHIVLNWAAIGLSILAAFVFGGIWYGPLFGKKWGQLLGFDITQKPSAQVVKKAIILQVVGLFLTSFCMSHFVQVWMPSSWNLGADGSPCGYGMKTAFFTWLGFYVPLQLGRVGWERRSWQLFFINATHDLISLLIISEILAYGH